MLRNNNVPQHCLSRPLHCQSPVSTFPQSITREGGKQMTYLVEVNNGNKDARGNASSLGNVTTFWHYTPWSYLPSIVQAGFLWGSNAFAEREKPMLWFSANQHWEPTATKMVASSTGKILNLTTAEQIEQFGRIRFGISANDSRLENWKNACITAGTPPKKRRHMESWGRKVGGNPAHWFATDKNIELSELHFQVWFDGWCDATSPQDMAAVWIECRGDRQSDYTNR